MTELINKDINESFSKAFLEYAGYNLQRRAIPDVRDGLKWGARQLLHAQMLGGFTYDKPFKKAVKSVAQAMGFSFVHGDSSAYGTLIRMAKPFSYRIPLQEANGNYGTLISPDDHSASRYVELRGSQAAAQVLKDLKKDTITEWEDTYDLEGQFPKVLPSKGLWLGVNGCISIGSGMACSIPPTNLREVNETLIRLIDNPDLPAEEVVCLPDFPTGAILLNANEVKESMINGYGKACKIRAVVEYDKAERCFIVKEMPYSTFTNTICNELATLMEDNPKCGIKNFVDYTGVKPDLRIYLDKKTNPDRVLKILYKETSLQTHFSINMVMLDKGTTPRVFGWKEALQAHIDHEKVVYRRSYEYDLRKIEARLHILEGLVKALNMIDEVVKTVKNAKNSADAKKHLKALLDADDTQAEAILKITLARLTHMEVNKLLKEQEELTVKADKIREILGSETLLNKEIEKGLREVADKFGDARRTKILSVETEEEEPQEIKTLVVNLSNDNCIYVTEESSLYTQKRGGVGNKFKVSKGEHLISTASGMNNDVLLFFSNKGNFYHTTAQSLQVGELIPVETLFNLEEGEQIKEIAFLSKDKEYVIFLTKRGFLKKSKLSEYNVKRSGGAKAIKLMDGDEIVSILFANDERICILSGNGNLVYCETKDINPIGRITKGVKGISLKDGDSVVAASLIDEDTKSICTVTEKGYAKKTALDEISLSNRAVQGAKIHKLKDDSDRLADFIPLKDEKTVIVVSENSQIRVSVDEISHLSKQAMGNKVITLKGDTKVIGILKI